MQYQHNAMQFNGFGYHALLWLTHLLTTIADGQWHSTDWSVVANVYPALVSRGGKMDGATAVTPKMEKSSNKTTSSRHAAPVYGSSLLNV